MSPTKKIFHLVEIVAIAAIAAKPAKLAKVAKLTKRAKVITKRYCRPFPRLAQKHITPFPSLTPRGGGSPPRKEGADSKDRARGPGDEYDLSLNASSPIFLLA
jgi:hypothetical protein